MLENFNGEFIYQETLIIFLNFNTKALKEEKKKQRPKWSFTSEILSGSGKPWLRSRESKHYFLQHVNFLSRRSMKDLVKYTDVPIFPFHALFLTGVWSYQVQLPIDTIAKEEKRWSLSRFEIFSPYVITVLTHVSYIANHKII